MQTALKTVYCFQNGHAGMKALLGSKGANLAEMARLGLPVPPGFTITTEVCNAYLHNGQCLPSGLMDEAGEALRQVEQSMRREFGNPENPLLLSVRSGASISMPGMMETVLNLGLNDETLQGLIRQSGDERFAYDTYRRFIQMFSSVVLGINRDYFEDLLNHQKKQLGIQDDTQLQASDLQALVSAYQSLVVDQLGRPFPQEPMTQLQLAIEAVFGSWLIPRAVAYRNHMGIDHGLGTAVTVQAMVFGNMGENSATGVAFTRNPSTGEKELYGEYLINAQGEDVVAGIRTPRKLSHLAETMPRIYQALSEIAYRLEHHYMDVQDMEFTVEQGQLFMLQTRTAKRTVQAAVHIAVAMVDEGLLTVEDALLRVDANPLSQLFLPAFNMAEKQKARRDGRLLATGLNASPGAATGMLVFDPGKAKKLAETGKKVILARTETCPDDVHGMLVAQGILTARGGNTSHAAVVARGLGKPCVAGCEACQIDPQRETLLVKGKQFREGDIVSIDGATGEVFEGVLATQPPATDEALSRLLGWADEFRSMEIRANADTPADAKKAVEMGAKGIGLCRTEHMFMAQERLPVVREMILAASTMDRRNALERLLPMQHADFRQIFQAMAGYPVTIRLLDPPLHEFLPNQDEIKTVLERLAMADPYQQEVKRQTAILNKVRELHEVNPMMGFRGCRLGLVYPEIYEIQVRAIFEAACDVIAEGGTVQPEIMIPLTGHASELRILREQVESLAAEIMAQRGIQVYYLFGTMIEVPRAAVTANQIAEYAEFFSFGTNDLTQLALGFSRDDSEGRFLAKYLEKGIIPENPFHTLDQEGVGFFMELSQDRGRLTRPDLKLGVCGEHGGEAKSVQYCHRIGLDYVSCSPFRVPVARLAAAQAVIHSRRERLTE